VAIFSLIAKNCWRNRRRTILTLLSVAVSFCLLGVLTALYQALFLSGDSTPSQATRLYVHSKVSLAQSIPLSYEGKLANLPGVRNLTIWQWFGGTYKDARNQKNFFARYGVDPKRLFDIRGELLMPEEQKKAFENIRTGCIVDQKLASKLGLKVGDKVPLIGDVFPMNLDLTLVGIYNDPQQSEVLLFNDQYLREGMRGSERGDQAGAFLIQADSAGDVNRVADEVDQQFANSPAPTKTESEHAYELGFVSFLGNLKLFLVAIAGAVTFTILLVSANTISMSVRERTREVGILKTLGFTRRDVLGIVLGEAVLIAIAGGAIGTLFAASLCEVVRQYGPAFIDALQKLTVTPEVVAISLGLAALIGGASAFVPAWRSSSTSILDALRFID
jgi:putative ABC transport system permease protein